MIAETASPASFGHRIAELSEFPAVLVEHSADRRGFAIWENEVPEIYRYALGRDWADLFSADHALLACGLNPSKAGAEDGDVTITKEIEFARRFGCTRLVKVNVFGLVSTDPKGLSTVMDPTGPRNLWAIAAVVRALELSRTRVTTLAAWGAHPMLTPERLAAVIALLPKPLHCLGTTKSGAPRHTSRLAYATPLQEWTP